MTNVCSPPASSHPDEETLELYAMQFVDKQISAALEEHLLVCLDCWIRLSQAQEWIALVKLGLASQACDQRRRGWEGQSGRTPVVSITRKTGEESFFAKP